MKKWKKFLIWFAWAIVFVVVDEITIFLIAHNSLNSWRLAIIEVAFMLLGVSGHYISIKLYTKKKRKQK